MDPVPSLEVETIVGRALNYVELGTTSKICAILNAQHVDSEEGVKDRNSNPRFIQFVMHNMWIVVRGKKIETQSSRVIVDM